VGAADGGLTAVGVRGWYLSLTRPPGTPPNWVFGAVWGVLYVQIGFSAWLIWRRPQIGQRRALLLWGWQLLVNALWGPAFFGLHSPGLALGVVLTLLVLVVLTIRRFLRLSRLAGVLLLPYALWTCYATYLTIGFLWLNPG
jgi:tryptophan-rich sensory protein